MKVQTIVNKWSVEQQGNGVAIRQMDYSPLSVSVRTNMRGELVIEVLKDGVTSPVFYASVEE